jgi:DNA-binding CsgD family transcriptional regulator
MAAPKAKTPQQSEAMDREINALDIRGYSHAEIAERLGISRPSVSARIKKLNARAHTDREAHIARELRTIEEALREALDAWEASKADAVVVTAERRGDVERITRRTEGQTGNPAHLANAIRLGESRRKLLGLDAPVKGMGVTLTAEQLAALSDKALEALYAKLSG